MKKSKYNYFFEYENKKLGFNSMSCALAEIDESFDKLYENIENINYEMLTQEEQELLDSMVQGNYVVSDAMDEIATLKFRNNKGKFSTDFLSLVIAPTLACNFGCPYCYENPKPGIISPEIQDKLVSIVKDSAEKKRKVDTTWYGGEPMLAKKVIYSLSERFMQICKENGVEYYAGIITNGYLITEEDLELFKRYNIQSVQITIDGPERVHNSRRFLKAEPSKGTFKPIIENIKKLDSMGFGISLRVNIDKNNIETTKELIMYFKEIGLKNLFINFGHVSAYTDSNQGIKETCLSMAEYSKESLLLQEFLHNNGFRSSGFPYYPGLKANYCGADSINTFVIDPEGYKYKCWNEVGNIEMSVGNIMLKKEEMTEEMINREVSYMTWSPFENETCRECFLLPICMGGCPYSGRKMGKAQCERWKYSLVDVLKKTYEQNKEK